MARDNREPQTPIVLTEADEALLAKLGPPPLDAIGNAEWLNNLAVAWSWIWSQPRDIDARERFQFSMEAGDRVGRTTTKASQSQRIGELQEKAGIKTRPKPDAARVISIDGSGAIRAGGRIQRRGAVGVSVPPLPAKDDG